MHFYFTELFFQTHYTNRTKNMEKQKNIKNLLIKFSKRELTPSEAKELALLVKQGDENKDLKKIITDYWDKSEHTDIEAPTYQLLERLEALVSDTVTKEKDVISTGGKTIYNLMKYAAVIVITFGMTWFAKDYTSSSVSTPTLLTSNETLHANEVSVLYGSKSKVTLPDGSVVNLNSGSILSYPARFDTKSRNVNIQGEAYFNVKKDAMHPFYVKTNGITIRVLGTKFNVKSYPDEKTVETTLVTGKIELYANNLKINDKNRLLVLSPHQQAIFEVNKGAKDSIISMVYNQNVDVNPITSWKDNRLMFRNEKFIDLAKKLKRWYNVDIEINDRTLQATAFSGVFVKETVEQSLNALKLASPFRYKMEKNKIIISKK